MKAGRDDAGQIVARRYRQTVSAQQISWRLTATFRRDNLAALVRVSLQVLLLRS